MIFIIHTCLKTVFDQYVGLHTQTSAHTDDRRGVWKKSFVFLCLTFNQTNPDTNKPIISVSTTTALSWSKFTFILTWFLCHCNLFSSARRNSREHNHNGFTRPWEAEYIQTWKKMWFSFTPQCCCRPPCGADRKWEWLLPAWAGFEGRLRGTMSRRSNVPALSPGSL